MNKVFLKCIQSKKNNVFKENDIYLAKQLNEEDFVIYGRYGSRKRVKLCNKDYVFELVTESADTELSMIDRQMNEIEDMYNTISVGVFFLMFVGFFLSLILISLFGFMDMA